MAPSRVLRTVCSCLKWSVFIYRYPNSQSFFKDRQQEAEHHSENFLLFFSKLIF